MNQLMDALEKWATENRFVESAIVVGSYARGTNKPTSDLDIVIITTNKPEMVKKQDFPESFGTVEKKQTEFYGACTSIRVWYENGPEIEFGIVEPSWIAVPLDAGTHQVLSGGYKVIVDKKRYFQHLAL